MMRTFDEFWLFYLREHARPATRALHLAGSTAALVCAVIGVATRAPVWWAIGLGVGYGCAWTGHFFVEHNRPATFRHRLWSFAADWKMWACAVSGRLGRELNRAGL